MKINAGSISAEQRFDQVRSIAESISVALRNEVFLLGLSVNCIDPDIDRADYSISHDPGSGEDSLIGIWRDHNGQKQGEMLFHADGSFYAEYDVIREHPKKTEWFIEAVTAWGRENMLKSDPKLLPAIK